MKDEQVSVKQRKLRVTAKKNHQMTCFLFCVNCIQIDLCLKYVTKGVETFENN